MSPVHVRLLTRECGMWCLQADQRDEAEAALERGDEWLTLLDVTGQAVLIRSSEIVGVYLWTPEWAEGVQAFSREVEKYVDDDEEREPWQK